ncbi:MAG: zinc-ribbon domain-containing protein [Syntrophaceae bacterium]|nr:zinc-ribbon domain-containing protein [Syntrophaceae bacterium]
MIITCASCLTKFNLDDSRISAKGVKVRCSRCKHVFYVVPPPETKEEIIEDAESFAKYHEDLIGPGEAKIEMPPKAKVEEKEKEREEEVAKEVMPEREEEETFLFSEKTSMEKMEEKPPLEKEVTPEKIEKEVVPERGEKLFFEEHVKEEGMEEKPLGPKRMLRAERRGFPRFFPLFIILVILIFGIFYIWTELGSGGRLSPYFESPMKKVTELWNQIWGVEKEDLIIGDLSGYEEKMGEMSLFIIEGKVKNQSRYTKKYIRTRVVLFSQEKLKVDEREAICGRILGREELRRQPPEFFMGEVVIKPETNQEMVIPSGKATPFMVIFKDPPSQAKEFKVEIVEAPNL